MRVFDYNGVLRDWAYLTATYGLLDHKVGARPGFELVQVVETNGPTELKVQALDEAGMPVRVMVVLTWPALSQPAIDLPDLTLGDAAKNQWSTRGVAQFTDGNGMIGFGLGRDSWIKDLAAGGPYHVWVFHAALGSDCLSRIGWLGGTEHRGPCFLTFKLNKSSTGPVDPGDPGDPGEPGTVPSELVPLMQEQLAVLRQLAAHLGVTL